MYRNIKDLFWFMKMHGTIILLLRIKQAKIHLLLFIKFQHTEMNEYTRFIEDHWNEKKLFFRTMYSISDLAWNHAMLKIINNFFRTIINKTGFF